MKKAKLNVKLSLNKKTVANLNNKEMSFLVGGGDTIVTTCETYMSPCYTYPTCAVTCPVCNLSERRDCKDTTICQS